MSDIVTQIENTYKARDMIVEKMGGPVPGTDLVTVLAAALTDDGLEGMTVDEVFELVCTVVTQRREGTES